MNQLNIPFIDGDFMRDWVHPIVKDLLDRRELDISDILTGVPKFDKDDPRPFIEWLAEQQFGCWEAPEGVPQLPYVCAIEIGGGIWVKSGLDCHLLVAKGSMAEAKVVECDD